MSAAIDEEEEILLSIFPEEFEKLSEDTFRIRLDPESSDEDIIAPILYLIAQLPPTYPDCIPHLSIDAIPSEDGTDLTAADKEELIQILNGISEENKGMAMVFTLATSLREEVTLLLKRRREVVSAALKAQQAAKEAEEQKRFEGTKVTRESFAAWNAQFKAELARRAQEEDERKVAAAKGERKLTGRQLFEGDTTLAASDLKIGDATDVEFDFSKFDKTTRRRGDEDDGDDDDEEEEVRHWAAESI